MRYRHNFARFTAVVLAIASFCSLHSQSNVLQISTTNSYKAIEWNEIDNIEFDVEGKALNIHIADSSTVSLPMTDGLVMPSGKTVPLIEITTDEDLDEVPDKVNYKTASFSLKGFEAYDDVEAAVNIRGRGNTSWLFPKKPYRLKFSSKISLCGLPAAKNYVLLANYLDPTLMMNAIAMKMGRMLNLPYTNTMVAVDVVLNGAYKGSYMLTNKPGINAGSVDIDEDNSIMWELDTAYDEEYKFRSPIWNLPVMVVDPDIDDETFERWKADFIEMEAAALRNNADDLVDMDVFARYLLVYDLTGNSEIGWPKSVKLFKEGDGKYIFGPIWDFDSCFGYVWETGETFSEEKIDSSSWRNALFKRLERSREAMECRKKYFMQLKEQLPEIMDFIDEYATTIETSYRRDVQAWNKTTELDPNVSKIKEWLTRKFDAIESLIEKGL